MGTNQQYYNVVMTTDVMEKCLQLNTGGMLSVLTTHKYKENEFQVIVQFCSQTNGFIHMQISDLQHSGKFGIEPTGIGGGQGDGSFMDLTDRLTILDKVQETTDDNLFTEQLPLEGVNSSSDNEPDGLIEVSPTEASVHLKSDFIELECADFETQTVDLSVKVKNELEINRKDHVNDRSHSDIVDTVDTNVDSDNTDIYNEADNSAIVDVKTECPDGPIILKISTKRKGRPRKINREEQVQKRPVKKTKIINPDKPRRKYTKRQKEKGLQPEINLDKLVKCELCDFSTSAKQYLGRHMRSKHPDVASGFTVNEFADAEPASCIFCNKKMLHVYSLYRHVKNQHKTTPGYEQEIERLEKCRRSKCPYCPTTVTRPSHLQRHIEDVHTYDRSNGVKCEECGVLLKNMSCYQNHIRYTHDKTEKKCLCTICGNLYKNVGHLNEHLRNVHCTDKFPCDIEGCDFIGNSAKYLKKHKKYKHGVATFMCDICARKFKCMQRLNLHYQLIHNIGKLEQHTCSECGKKFNLKSNMKKHIDGVHKKTWRFKCDFCEKGFFSSKLLGVHIMKNHSINTDPTNESKEIQPYVEPVNILPVLDYSTTSSTTESSTVNNALLLSRLNSKIVNHYASSSYKSSQQPQQEQNEAENLSWNNDMTREYNYYGPDYRAVVQSVIHTHNQQPQHEDLNVIDKKVVDSSSPQWQNCTDSGNKEKVWSTEGKNLSQL